MKHIYLLLMCLGVFLHQNPVQAQSNVIDEVIWVVGDDAIFLSDVENTRLTMQLHGQQIQGDPYCTIPEQLAIQKLFLHQAKLDSVDVPDSKVSGYVEQRINYAIQQAGGSQEKLEEWMNKSINAIREEWRTGAKEEQTIREVQEGLVGKIQVTPSEVRNFYNRIPQDSLPYITTTVEVQIITREPQVSLQEIDDIKNRLRDYTEQATSGKMQFSTLARLYSDDKESAIRGGELGFQGKGSLTPEFAAVAFDLNDPKRVSRIVETEYGYHIIQLIEKRGDRINVRHILIRPRVTKEEINTATQQIDSLRKDILAGKFTFEDATYFSSDKDTRNNKGLMVNNPDQNSISSGERAGTSKFEMSELPSEIAKAVDVMKVGDISPAFTMINPKTNKEIVAMVKLKSRVDGHKASLSEDFQAIKSMMENEKRAEILHKWIAKKQKETYIRINENWKKCDFESDGWIQK